MGLSGEVWGGWVKSVNWGQEEKGRNKWLHIGRDSYYGREGRKERGRYGAREND